MRSTLTAMQTDNGKATNRDESQDRRIDPGGYASASDESSATTTRLGARYTVQEAAEMLGTTIDGVRGRIRRGTLDSMKVDSVVYVLLDETSRDRHSDKTTSRLGEPSPDQPVNLDQSELVGEMRGQIDWLRREVERKDTIIMALTQRVPDSSAIEAPQETRDEPETTSEIPEGTDTPAGRGQAETGVHRASSRSSWWRRFFFD